MPRSDARQFRALIGYGRWWPCMPPSQLPEISQFERGGRSVARQARPKPGSPSPVRYTRAGLSEEVGDRGAERKDGLPWDTAWFASRACLAGCTAQARGNCDNNGAIARRRALRTDQPQEMIISDLTYLAPTHRRWRLARLAATGQHNARPGVGQGRWAIRLILYDQTSQPRATRNGAGWPI